MSNSTAVDRPQAAALPALANTPALDIGADDITLPKMYRGEGQSSFVQQGMVPLNCLFLATGEDDPDPQVLWTPPAKGEERGDDDGVLAHVLGLRKGKSLSEDGQLQTWAFNDPDAPPEAWVTYSYTVALPETEDGADLPVKVLMTRTSTPTARRINFLLKKNEGRLPSYGLAFRLTTAPRETTKGNKTYRWCVYQARQVEAKPENVELAAGLAEMVASSPSIERQTGPSAEPAI